MKNLDELLPKQPYSKIEKNWLGRMFGGKTHEGDVDGATLFEKFRISIARWVIIWLCDNPSILASALESTKTTPVVAPAPAPVIDHVKVVQDVLAMLTSSGRLADDVAKVMRQLISEGLPDDLLKKLAKDVGGERKRFFENKAKEKETFERTLVRTAIPMAWKELNWSDELQDSLVSDVLVAQLYDAKVAEDLNDATSVTKNVVAQLTMIAKNFEQALVEKMGYKAAPATQKGAIAVVTRRSILMGQTADEAYDVAIAQSELTPKK